MKRILAVLLALALLCTTASVFAESADHTKYSQFPLVKDGQTATITVVHPRNDTYGAADAEDMWFWKWSQEVTGIDFQIEMVSNNALSEKKSLMFASDELPDMIIDFGLTCDEIMTYGAQEGQLKALNDWITEERTPYLYAWFEAYPEAKAACTAADGNIYTLPAFENMNYANGEVERMFINKEWLDALGLENPTTIDELTTVLYAFKEAYPDCTPLGSAASVTDNTSNPGDYTAFTWIMNAFGYLTNSWNDFGYGVAIRNGEAVIPAADPTFKEVLKLLNQYYTDGILDKDVFTTDVTALNADTAEGKVGVYPNAPVVVFPQYEDFSKWECVNPLTSEYNDTKIWLKKQAYDIGGLVFSSKITDENLDLALRYVDYFYSDLGGITMWWGPMYESADTLGLLTGVYLVDSEVDGVKYRNTYYTDVVDKKLYENTTDLLYKEHCIAAKSSYGFGNRSHSLTVAEVDSPIGLLQLALGYDEIVPYAYNTAKGDGNFRQSMVDHVKAYEVDGYPNAAYYTAEQVELMNEVNALIKPHIISEVAKFITGARSLDEFDQFVAELEQLGIREVEQIYKDYWNASK